MLANTPTADTTKRPAKYRPNVLVTMLMLLPAVPTGAEDARSIC